VRNRPGELGVHVQRQHAVLACGHDLAMREAVKTHQPVGLVEPVFAHGGRRDQRQRARRIGDGAEGRVVHAPQPVHAVQAGAGGQDGAVVGGVGADDHLRALAARRKVRGRGPAGARRGGHGHQLGGRLLLARLPRVLDVHRHARHRACDGCAVLLRRERGKALGRGQLHVDAQPVGMAAGALHQFGRGIGNGLEVDVATEIMLLAQHARHFHHLLHGVVGALDDAAGEEQPLNAVAPVKIEREVHHLLHREAGARHIAADPVHAVQAVVLAEIGQQDLEQRDAAPVGRIAVANAHALGRTHAAPAHRIARRGAARRAGGVVLGGVGQYGQFGLQDHCMNLQ